MLACSGLKKSYQSPRGTVEAVRGIDLAFDAGSFCAIIGRSGSGKSTLLAMLGGLSRPSAGDVLIDGTRIWSLTETAIARFRNQRIGYIFQFAGLLPVLSAIDNVALPAKLGRAPAAGAQDRARALLADMGLAAHLDALPSEMSVGEQRRVSIARAMVNDPLLLLADEPTSDLDEQTEREIMALLVGVAEDRKTTLIVVTHNLALAAGATQITHITEGKVVA